MFNHETGRLRQTSTRSGGKLIDEWKFRSVFEKEPDYTVRVSMIVDGEGARFVATCEQLPKEKLENTDIEQLRRTTERKLKEHSLIQNGAVWEDWLEIKVVNEAHMYQAGGIKGTSRQDENARGLQIAYQPIKRGTHPAFPDRVFTINSNSIAVDFPEPKAGGEFEDDPSMRRLFGDTSATEDPRWRGLSGRAKASQYAYIPDTPANRASLDHLLHAMDQLGMQLQGFLAQAGLADNLHRLSDLVDPMLRALPAPSGSQDNAPFSETDGTGTAPRRSPRPR